MPGERIQHRIERLLDQADEAFGRRDWSAVCQYAQDALLLEGENPEALAFLAAAQKALGTAVELLLTAPESSLLRESEAVLSAGRAAPFAPASFAAGRYAVMSVLGQGGMGAVYQVHDTRLDRVVALKTIRPEHLSDPDASARFFREAQVLARLNHPNILTLFESGQDGDTHYLVMELGGPDLEALLEFQAGPLPLEQVLEVGIGMARALEYAHRQGIFHRDLKPANVLVGSPGGGSQGIVKVMDFGLAKIRGSVTLTAPEAQVGTPKYMAPEQALGQEADERSDLYALGATLYEIVTGRPPFLGQDAVAIITQLLTTPPVAPSWHNPDVPPALEALILRLLEKDPTQRPQTAGYVVHALAGIDLRAPAAAIGEAAPAAAASPLYRRTFVGRESELHQLQAAYDLARSGEGSLVMVVGEPGIGKTALCEQLATYATVRGGRVLVGHSYEEGSLSLPYLAFVEALRTYVLARPTAALQEELGTGAADVARIISEVRDKVQVELRPSGDAEDNRWHLLQAVTDFLWHAAAAQPLVLVLEDLHWADRGTLDLLTHVARHFGGARLLIIGTYRDVEVDRAHPLSSTLAELRRGSQFGRILLRGLTADDVERMLSSVAGQEVTWGLAEAVYRQTEGNPLFVQEVMRYLSEEGLIRRQDGRWQATGQTPLSMSIPEGLREVIGKRLSRLSVTTNRILSIAAVIGPDFTLETLQAVAQVADEAVLSALEEAVRLAVLEEQARSTVVRYRFAHAFVRQTLYEEMLAPRRLRLHQQVARALELQHAGRLEEHAAELAEHFAQSTDPTDLAKAIEYAELAADRAVAVYAYSEAARLLEQALGVQEVLDSNNKVKRCDLLLKLGEMLIPAGEPKRAADDIAEQALTMAEALGATEKAAQACVLALQGLLRYGQAAVTQSVSFRQWAERADRYATPESTARGWADQALGVLHNAVGNWAEMSGRLESALELARKLHDTELFFSVAGMMLSLLHAPRRHEVHRRLAQEVAEYSRLGVNPSTLGQTLWYSSWVLLQWGDRPAAEELFRQTDELAQRTQEPRLILTTLATEARLAVVEGQLEAAITLLERNVARSDELGSPVSGRMGAGFTGARPLLHLGRGEEAIAAQPRAAQMAGAPMTPRATSIQVLCLAHVGRRAEAQAGLTRMLTELKVGGPDDETPADIAAHLLETAILVEDRNAMVLLGDVLAPCAASLSIILSTCVGRHLGSAAARLGNPEQARRYYAQALEVAHQIRHRPEIALTRLQIAQLDAEEGDTAMALEHLSFCIPEFEAMGMRPALEWARALRERLMQ